MIVPPHAQRVNHFSQPYARVRARGLLTLSHCRRSFRRSDRQDALQPHHEPVRLPGQVVFSRLLALVCGDGCVASGARGRAFESRRAHSRHHIRNARPYRTRGAHPLRGRAGLPLESRRAHSRHHIRNARPYRTRGAQRLRGRARPAARIAPGPFSTSYLERATVLHAWSPPAPRAGWPAARIAPGPRTR